MRDNELKAGNLAEAHHKEMFILLSQIEKASENERDLNELVDTCYVLKYVAQHAERIVKAAELLQERLGKRCCAIWASTSATSDKIKTDYAIGTPSIKTVPKVPKKADDPEAYAKFLQAFGVPAEMSESPFCPLRLNWPDLVEYATDLAASGRNLPKGINPDDTYTLYGLGVQARKDKNAKKL